jgi:hypothetical protein
MTKLLHLHCISSETSQLLPLERNNYREKAPKDHSIDTVRAFNIGPRGNIALFFQKRLLTSKRVVQKKKISKRNKNLGKSIDVQVTFSSYMYRIHLQEL